MIISASGMAEAGRILHHLRNSIENPRNTVLIPGFQAENTLGRKIVEKQREVSIFGDPMRLRAEVVTLNALSGHADQKELLTWMKENNLDKLIAKTQIIIAPPYKLKLVNILITNFHQPGSTLLLLVAAVIGDDWKKVYDYALQNNFRFLSYGDGCLLFSS